MTQDSVWTEQRLARLRQMWGAGVTASNIALALGGGLSRNAVVGKAHRMGLAGRPSPIKRHGAPTGRQRQTRETIKRHWDANLKVAAAAREQNRRQKDAGTVAQTPKAPPPPSPVYHRALAKQVHGRSCAWPIGDPRLPGFRFCGEQAVVVGRSYCEAHCSVAFQRKAAE